MADMTKELFNDLVREAESLFTDDERAMLRMPDKDEAVTALHLSVGARIREVLGLWKKDASPKLDAIYKHSNQGMLLGYDADGGSTALLEFLWDKAHSSNLGSFKK